MKYSKKAGAKRILFPTMVCFTVFIEKYLQAFEGNRKHFCWNVVRENYGSSKFFKYALTKFQNLFHLRFHTIFFSINLIPIINKKKAIVLIIFSTFVSKIHDV